MQWWTGTVMMLLPGVKADGGEKLGWEGGSTVWMAVWFTPKEQSQVPSSQMQQNQTACRQPAPPLAPVCGPGSLRSSCPPLLVQLWVILPQAHQAQLLFYTLDPTVLSVELRPSQPWDVQDMDTALPFFSGFCCTEGVGYDFCWAWKAQRSL